MLTPKSRSKKGTRPGRVDAPAGKQQYMDKEESTRPGRVDAPVGKQQYMDEQVSTRPGRVDAPAGKQQYMDKEESTRPGRVDAPAGKGQYMDSEENPKPSRVRPSGQNSQSTSSSRPHRVDYPGQGVQGTTQRPERTEEGRRLSNDAVVAGDRSTMQVDYRVTVTSFGKQKSKVLDLIMGVHRSRNDNEYEAPLTFTGLNKEDIFAMAVNLSGLGAKVEVKKTILIEIPIAST